MRDEAARRIEPGLLRTDWGRSRIPPHFPDTGLGGGWRADLRLGLASRMVMWDENDDEGSGFSGMEIADVRAESGGRCNVRIEYDPRNSMSADLAGRSVP